MDSKQARFEEQIDVDRKSLRMLVERFRSQQLNRLHQLYQTLNIDQRLVLRAMPLLIHSGHAALPGYVNAATPTGIDNYRPDPETQRLMRQIALSYSERRFIKRQNHIQALFLNPSLRLDHRLGTHHMRFLLCCEETRHNALSEKTERLKKWAESLGVATEFQLISPGSQLGHNASTTPALDLDNFYSAGIHLAGRFPLWWLIPPDCQNGYAEYARRLLHQRFIKASDYFDLGNVIRIPPQEIFVAGLAALQKAFRQPRETLLSLLLLEAYATQGEKRLLSQEYKVLVMKNQASSGGETSNNGEDLAQGRALASRSLIQYLSAYLSPRGGAARLKLLEDSSSIEIEQLLLEDQQIKAELHVAYRRLKDLATELPELLLEPHSNEPSRNARMLDQLGFALANLEPEKNPATRGALAKLMPALLVSNPQGHVVLCEMNGIWQIRGTQAPLFEAERLARIAAWAVQQGIRIEHIYFGPGVEPTPRLALARLMEILQQGLSSEKYHGIASSPEEWSDLWILVNAQEEGLDGLTVNGEALLSSRDDALDFSGFRHNLVRGIDLVIRDGLGHVVTESYLADDALENTLKRALQLMPVQSAENESDNSSSGQVAVHSIGTLKSHQIERRLRQLIWDLKTQLTPTKLPASGTRQINRFLFALGEGFVLCRLNENSQLETTNLRNEEELFGTLGSAAQSQTKLETPGFSVQTAIDAHSPALARLHQFMLLVNPGQATLLIESKGLELSLMLAEENGLLHRWVTTPRSQQVHRLSLDSIVSDVLEFLRVNHFPKDATFPRLFKSGEDQITELSLTRHSLPGTTDASRKPKGPGRETPSIFPGSALVTFLNNKFNYLSTT